MLLFESETSLVFEFPNFETGFLHARLIPALEIGVGLAQLSSLNHILVPSATPGHDTVMVRISTFMCM
jgi:O-succinylbenzoate synthase